MINVPRVDHSLTLFLSILLPVHSLCAHEVEPSWANALPVAVLFSAIVGGLAIAKKVASNTRVTTTLNNRFAYPLHQRFRDEDMDQDEEFLREQNREYVEKSLTSLIVRTQKRLAVIGVALTIAAASGSQWWTTFANNVGWIQVRTSFGLSMLYYFHGQEGVAQPLFSSPIRESVWIASTLLYTHFADMHRDKELMDIYDFPEWVLIWLSCLYEMGRIDS